MHAELVDVLHSRTSLRSPASRCCRTAFDTLSARLAEPIAAALVCPGAVDGVRWFAPPTPMPPMVSPFPFASRAAGVRIGAAARLIVRMRFRPSDVSLQPQTLVCVCRVA
ncbi:unnamed protein product [Cercospora beticola]|nr:unnamed protein product [Cercospora beticola]